MMKRLMVAVALIAIVLFSGPAAAIHVTNSDGIVIAERPNPVVLEIETSEKVCIGAVDLYFRKGGVAGGLPEDVFLMVYAPAGYRVKGQPDVFECYLRPETHIQVVDLFEGEIIVDHWRTISQSDEAIGELLWDAAMVFFDDEVDGDYGKIVIMRLD
jgi:hypothetical protein